MLKIERTKFLVYQRCLASTSIYIAALGSRVAFISFIAVIGMNIES